ncbi:MAG: hypothetical protein AABX29_00785 [Nanoarchaeota archaeon]
MNTEVYSLRTENKGKFSVVEMLDDSKIIRISLPHRASFILGRLGDVLFIDYDLGWGPDDDKRICEIDLSKKDYKEAIYMDKDFIQIARPHESSFQVGKFVKYFYENYDHISAKLFGEDWLDQVYIHFIDPHQEQKCNLEFSVRKAKYIEDFDGRPELLTEPAMTLVASFKLPKRRPHYFLFIECDGDNKWRYSKDFFYNNSVFHKKNEVLQEKK